MLARFLLAMLAGLIGAVVGAVTCIVFTALILYIVAGRLTVNCDDEGIGLFFIGYIIVAGAGLFGLITGIVSAILLVLLRGKLSSKHSLSDNGIAEICEPSNATGTE